MRAEKQRQIEDPQATCKQQGACERLYGKFQIRACAAHVVVNSEQKNQHRGGQNCEQRLGRKATAAPEETLN